jgi:dethiobiotin synthetase
MIIAVVGTGTGIGKTHVASALLGHLCALGHRAVGWKPVESGVDGDQGQDEAQLREACGVAAPTVRLAAPLSPHLAARRQGVALDQRALVAVLAELAARFPIVVVELAGGWFSPVDDELDNAEWLASLPAALRQRSRILLVAPDRLGVLHDVSAAVRAGAGLGLRPAVIALSAPAQPDDATGSNAEELRRRGPTRAAPVVMVPRATVEALARGPAIAELAGLLTDPSTPAR